MFGSQVSLAEDALSTYYSTGSNTDSLETMPSSNSSNTSLRRASGSVLSFLKLNWLGFGVDHEKERKDKELIENILTYFRSEDVQAMEKLQETEISKEDDDDEYWWDNSDFSTKKTEPKPKFVSKNTPHVKKLMSHLPPSVRKTVRFEMDFTPENARPFTPLFTSTPKHTDVPSDEDEPVPLYECESNTVMPPNAINNTSSILLTSTSVMESWNKSREQTVRVLENVARHPMHYRVCYDDTDEEEVVEDEEEERQVPVTPLRNTFVVSASREEQTFEPDTSTDSSVVLGVDRIFDYIRSLENDIESAHRYMREKDVKRAQESMRQANILQDRLCQMQEMLNEMRDKWVDDGADGDRSDVSAVFENSCWAAKFDGDDGNFGAEVI